MNKNTVLSHEQRELVSQHTKIVEWTIYDYIHVNETLVGLGYDDLYQEGCLALCHAAVTFNHSTKFKTYAQVVVKNHILGYCRGIIRTNKDLSLDTSLVVSETFTFSWMTNSTDEEALESIAYQDTLKLLESAKKRYNGVALKGIEAIELKIKGYSGKEIAQMYGVKSTHVGAWISRAAQKLRKDEQFLKELQINS